MNTLKSILILVLFGKKALKAFWSSFFAKSLFFFLLIRHFDVARPGWSSELRRRSARLGRGENVVEICERLGGARKQCSLSDRFGQEMGKLKKYELFLLQIVLNFSWYLRSVPNMDWAKEPATTTWSRERTVEKTEPKCPWDFPCEDKVFTFCNQQ